MDGQCRQTTRGTATRRSARTTTTATTRSRQRAAQQRGVVVGVGQSGYRRRGRQALASRGGGGNGVRRRHLVAGEGTRRQREQLGVGSVHPLRGSKCGHNVVNRSHARLQLHDPHAHPTRGCEEGDEDRSRRPRCRTRGSTRGSSSGSHGSTTTRAQRCRVLIPPHKIAPRVRACALSAVWPGQSRVSREERGKERKRKGGGCIFITPKIDK